MSSAAVAGRIVIIPALNEAESLGAVLQGIEKQAPGFDVVVVDDGSRDATADVALAAGATVLRHRFNLGYGGALQTGYRYAARGPYDLLVQLDGDGQHLAASIPGLIEPILDGRADIVLGSRFFPGSTYRMPALRRIGRMWLRLLLRLTTGLDAQDPTTGLQAMSRPVFELYAREGFPADYPDADMLILLHRLDYRVLEVPATMRSESRVSMHSGLRAVYYVYKMTLSMLMNLLRPLPADRRRKEEKR